MTKDDIIRMAREAGGTAYTNRHCPGETAMAFGPQALERFAKLIAAAEREACAMACDTEADNPSCLWEEPGCWKHAAENCAGAIRARGQQ